MAGGNETPRQKMIGMMYLVLTALLALNVSKQIVAAFITLNNKIENSADIIDIKSKDAYGQIETKRVTLIATGGDTKELEYWNEKANILKKETAEIVGFILGECNDMINESEGKDWVQEKDEDGNITRLKPLEEISGMDNYDIPTNMFVGGNPKNPNERGQALVQKIHEYRNSVTTTMGTYEKGGNQYTFIAPDSPEGLSEALLSANKDDTASIAQMYRTLTIPAELHAHGEDEMLPWISVTFDHAPIVAAAAMFTSLKLDVKNAEANAATYYAAKIDAPLFKFNKIEPMTLAPTQYINQNDSLPLRIAVAAYDTTDMAVIRYGIDGDTLPENWTETTGALSLSGKQPGSHKVKGVIGIQERGERKWKPWEFDYTVGQPMGVVAQPEMRVLYWGYDNVVEATGSGFANENISITTTNCRIEQKGGKKIVKVSRGTREATVGVVGRNDDGSTMSLGSFKFKCVPLPSPELTINGAENGSTVQYVQAKNFSKVRLAYDESITLTGVNFKIKGGSMRVGNIGRQIEIQENGVIPSSASSLLNQSRGKMVTGEVRYSDPSGITKIEAFSFKVR